MGIGIIIGFYFTSKISIVYTYLFSTVSFLIIFRRLPISKKYSIRWIEGILMNGIFFCLGMVLIHTKDPRQARNWIGHYLSATTKPIIKLSILEPLLEKDKSYKTTASANAIFLKDRWVPISGTLIVYFAKDSQARKLYYGSSLLVQIPIQPIKNMGNPGGFDYQQYCAFQGIYHQIYLKKENYQLLAENAGNRFMHALFTSKEYALSILTKYIPGKKEAGVAEALLIGYRVDLDKDLVQSYSNTGVVHIIAISGLHLGMIYGLLLLLLKPLRQKKYIHWVKPLLLLSVLWGFSLLTGASASILRSAVMFSFIIAGESLHRRTNIYNTLAASAFCLLVFNPYLLWDTGFLLSYTAVLSILVFMKPIYQCFYLKNKILNHIWQLNAVTLSAQILTLPLILFYFHQFPNFFLLANFIAVPLSGLILYGELLLLVFAKIPFLNESIGKIDSFLIKQMNGYIERTGKLPFAVTDTIPFSVMESILLYGFLFSLAYWFFQKNQRAFLISLGCFLLISGYRFVSWIRTHQQTKLIVYNIPRHSVMDIIQGNRFQSIGDSEGIQHFHVKAARKEMGLLPGKSFAHLAVSANLIASAHTSVLVINSSSLPKISDQPLPVDIIVISNNPNLEMEQIAHRFTCRQIVFDSSNPLWKIREWKKQADSLHLRHHATLEQGAYIVSL